MTVPPELVWLIKRLRSTPSRRKRLQLLLEGRRVVRDLSPSDRLAVARELGFDGAERLVEEIADRRGFSPEPWLKLLGEVARDGGDEAIGAARGLLDPTTRGATVSRLVDAASGWVAELDADRPQPVPGEDGAALIEEPGTTDGAAVETGEEMTHEIEEVGDASDDVAPRITSDEAFPPRPPSEEVLVKRPPPPPVVSASNGEGDPADAEPPSEPVIRIASGPEEGHLEPPLEASEESADFPAVMARIIGELADRRQSSARLAILRGAVDGLAGADAHALKKILAEFPGGWARRRALETLFWAGVPASLGEAIGLLDVLTRPSEMMWALTTLAGSRSLSADEVDALLAAAGSRALARRLSHRIRRSA